MKAQVVIIEMITTVLVLFIAFTILFSGVTYKSKWKDSLMFLMGRDILLSLDRSGRLYEISFNSQLLIHLTTILFPDMGIIPLSATDGTIKTDIYIACNCTGEQINFLYQITKDLKVNNRNINITFCQTSLEKINPCSTSLVYPDALIIWGYKSLGAEHVAKFRELIINQNGILEISDLQSGQIDQVQQRIFGLKWLDLRSAANNDSFIKPNTISQLSYQSYKYFYHLPFLLEGVSTDNIPVEGIPSPSCSQRSTGNLTFKNIKHTFWVCDVSSVYWDNNNNGLADMNVNEGNDFQLYTYNFTLSHIDTNSKIRVTFRPEYNFEDFLQPNSINKLYPSDDDRNKILLSKGFDINDPNKPVPVVIFNGTGNGKTAWIADFSRDGFSTIGDDHKNLLISLLLSVSNKKTNPIELVKTGYANSYINVKNRDMFEVYRIDLSLGFPF
ncbi:MAG: hypothetical protein QXO27_03835 [Candidatus Aenigmatarchaeota archaeon]